MPGSALAVASIDATLRPAPARDANGHLLLDFDHDGELDVTTAGFAFQEHRGRAAGNVRLGQPFSVFWYDDNWLGRYLAQAFGRPLPDGLSAYGDLTRWQIVEAANSLEFRAWWYGTSDLEVAEIRVAEPRKRSDRLVSTLRDRSGRTR